jgi:hypothetical protein
MADTFQSTFQAFLSGYVDNGSTYAATVNADGSFWNITMTAGASVFVLRDSSLSGGATPKTVLNYLQSWKYSSGSLTVTAIGGIRATLQLAENYVGAMYSMFNGLITVATHCTDYQGNLSAQAGLTSFPSGTYWLVDIAIIEGAPGRTIYTLALQAIGNYPESGNQYNNDGIAVGGISAGLTQPIQAVWNSRRSVAAATQPTMSPTPGGDPPVDNAGLFVLYGNPSSINLTAEPVVGWTDVADADIDIQDTQATLTICGRCLTGKGS